MADNNPAKPSASGEPASNRMTLEQALLAPLDSILKAQLHAARSFLNMLLQLGYPHSTKPNDPSKSGQQSSDLPDEPYHLEFAFRDRDDNSAQILRVPALSLVPISPLAVDSADFELEMSATQITKKTQIRQSEKHKTDTENDYNDQKRPWFLVEEPMDISGEITRRQGSDQSSQESSIKINIHVKSIAMPSGLEKLLTTLTNMSEVRTMDGDKPKSPAEN